MIFTAEGFVKNIFGKDFFKKNLINNEFELKQLELQAILKATTLSQREVEGTVGKVASLYDKKMKKLKKEGVKSSRKMAINNEILLKNRLESLVVWNEVQNLKKEHQGQFYRWLPSSSKIPDPEHQLLYGKIFKVGEGDKEGNMPSERYGCKCGIQFLEEPEKNKKEVVQKVEQEVEDEDFVSKSTSPQSLKDEYLEALAKEDGYYKEKVLGKRIPVSYMKDGKLKTQYIDANDLPENAGLDEVRKKVYDNLNSNMKRAISEGGESALKIGDLEKDVEKTFIDGTFYKEKAKKIEHLLLDNKQFGSLKEYENSVVLGVKRETEKEKILQKEIFQKAKKDFSNTYLGQKGVDVFEDENGMADVAFEDVAKEIRAFLKQEGWQPYHSSGKKVVSSSSYYQKGDKTIRLSDHYLPETAERAYKTAQGLRKGWTYEIVLDKRKKRMDFALKKDKNEFIKEILNWLE